MLSWLPNWAPFLNLMKFMMMVSTAAMRKAMWAQLFSDPSTQVILSLRTFLAVSPSPVDAAVVAGFVLVDDLRPTVSPSTKTPEWYMETTERWMDSARSLPMKLSTTQMPYLSRSRTTHWQMSISHSILSPLSAVYLLSQSLQKFLFLIVFKNRMSKLRLLLVVL